VEHSGGHPVAAQELNSPKAMPSFLVEPDEEHTVALRQYIGVGTIGGPAPADEEKNVPSEENEEKEASENKMRWLYRSPMLGLQLEAGRGSERWDAWHPIQAVPLVASGADAPGDTASVGARMAAHAHANLTLHPLLPSPERDNSLNDADLGLTEPTPSVLACHLVSQPDAFGSSTQVLVVSSALLLVNRTFVDMEVALVDGVGEEVLFQQLVRSGQSLPLPVLLVPWKRVKLLVRPGGSSYRKTEWHWSNSGFRLSLLHYDAAKHTVLRCQPHSESDVASPLQRHVADPARGVALQSDVFCCGINVFTTAAPNYSTSTGVDAAAVAALGTDPTLYTLALDPPLSFKNLLGCDVSYQVTLRERSADASFVHTRLEQMSVAGRMAGYLPHRQEVHWYHMDLGAASSAVVTLQLRRGDRAVEEERIAVANGASLVHSHHWQQSRLLSSAAGASAAAGDWSSEWSSEVVIHSTTDVTEPSSSLILHDREGVKLRIQLDYSAPQHQHSSVSSSASVYPYAHAGEGLVTAYVPHWFANQSGLPLVYANVDDSLESDDSVQLCAGQSAESLRHAAQALMDIEGLDELAAARRSAQDGSDSHAVSSSASHKSSWFHFRDARRQFGTETRLGLHALLDDPDQVVADWKWTSGLARRPLDERVFLLNPVSQLEESLADDARERDLEPQPIDVYLLPVRGNEKRRAMIRLPNTDWSQPFSVDTVGWDGTLQLTELPRRPAPETSLSVSDSAYELPRPTDRPLRVYTLGVSICMHPHLRFHRTKIVKVAPRYILSNQTLHTLEFRQIGSEEVRSLAPKQRVPIHWLDQGAPTALSLRVGSYGWNWAAKRFGIALESVGVLSVRLRNSHTHDVAVMHVWTALKGATFEITVMATWEQTPQRAKQGPPSVPRNIMDGSGMLGGYAGGSMDLNSSINLNSNQLLGSSMMLPLHTAADDLDLAQKTAADASEQAAALFVPYRIENRSSMRTLQFHQAGESKLIQRLLPFQSCPYAWDEPWGKKEIELYCVSGPGAHHQHDGGMAVGQRVGSYSLDRIGRYPSVWLPKGRGDSEDPKLEEDQVFVQVYAHGRVRVLKLVDLAWANSAGLTDTQASLNAAASKLTGPTGWSVELRLAGIGLSLITHVRRAASATPYNAAAASASMSHLRTSSLLGGATSSSSHPLAVLGVPYTRQELLHLSIQSIRLRLSESVTTQTQSIKASIGHIQLDNQLHSAVYPVVLCSVSRVQSSKSRWSFAGKKTKLTEPELDLDDDFFNVDALTPGAAAAMPLPGSTARVGLKAPATRKKPSDTVPCWFSVSLLRSHERSTEDFLFMPGLAVRMSLLKINVEEKLLNHLLRFGELLAPALALMSKSSAPPPLPSAGLQPYIGSGPSPSGAQQLFGLATFDANDLGSSPLPPVLGRSHSSSFTPTSSDGSLSPTGTTSSSLQESFDELDTVPDEVTTFHAQQPGGVIGRLALPSAEVAPLSALDYSRIDLHQRDVHPSGKVERESSGNLVGIAGGSGVAGSVLLAPKLERPLILYFQQLIVHTIEISVSISSSGEQGEDDGATTSAHPLRVLLRAVGATLLNFEDASLKFGALELPDVFASGEELGALVQLHYLKQASRQVYQLLGSSDFLGNPAALFSSISTGFGDLLYKPAIGLTESPTGVVTGAFGGVRSFVQHTLYGVSSAGSKVSSSIAKGLSSLSMSDGAQQHVTVGQLFRLPRDGWRHRGVRGFVGGSVRATLGFGGILAHRVSRAMDSLRTLLNPSSRLQRTREPLFFQSGTKPRVFHLRMARFITSYLAQHPHETFVLAVEQETPTPMPQRTPVFFKAQTAGNVTSTPSSPNPASSTAASASAASGAASPSSVSLAGVPTVRVPGGRVCLLLTTHTLVLFVLFESLAKEPRLLHTLPLDSLNTPVTALPQHTLFAIDPMQQQQQPQQDAVTRSGRTSQRRSMAAAARPRLPPAPRVTSGAAPAAAHAALSLLPSWLVRLLAGEVQLPASKLAVPVHLSPQQILHAEQLIAAARAQSQRDAQAAFSPASFERR